MSEIKRSAYHVGLLGHIAMGKYRGCELSWLSDQDLQDLQGLSVNLSFRSAVSGLLRARGSPRRRRMPRGATYPAVGLP